ncbi:MFS transporter [Spirosoma sp. KCTC 42546]|uniref:MFS transporter n=1 Tax=Spirosoma sp. KCTC 42546 TaxID=2520506 RepID=UPI0011580146|nr:MFS transporter [Spirosoma sp. KCTC 42546]QDK80699.1 MFS transporter [Spirosoma sp. KCTC 42546]
MEQLSGKAKATRVRYGMLALVFVNVAISYLDRTNIGVAASALGKDLNLSKIEMGYILSAFGWAYAALQIPGGLIADRFGPRILYAFCLITWSIVTLAHVLVRGIASLFFLRLATGTLEAPSYPINNRVVTQWFPNNERASAIAMYVSGQFIGLAFLSPILAMVQVYAGWRGLFIGTGLLGLVWGIIWYLFYRDPLDSANVNKAELDYIEEGGGLFRAKDQTKGQATIWQWSNIKLIFSSRTLWGVYIGQFCVNATLWFFLTWFPTYLVEYRHLSFIKSGYLGSIPFLAACAGLLLSGFLSDWLISQGKSVSLARKAPIIIGFILSLSIVGANYTDNNTLVIFFLSFAFFGIGMALISWIFVSTLSPKHLIGLTSGVFNFMGNLASIVVPIGIGYLIQGGSFKPALVFIGTIEFIGACSYIFLVGKIERIESPIQADINEGKLVS